jgi:pyruvate formate lyase activating enzyme
MQGIVFNIQRFSVNDGPGIRTTVFLKGCPLGCWWCHNPEGMSFGSDTIKGKEIGKEWDVKALFEEIDKDRIFYDESGGGVTFSGGEPLAQPEFLEAALKKCSEEGIHTVVDTSGYADKEVFKKIMPFTNLFLYDLKLIDKNIHLKYTERSNELILENLNYLIENNARVIIRIPLIQEITATIQNLEGIIDYLNHFETKPPVHFLNFHRIAESKYEKFGITNRMKGRKECSSAIIEEVRNLFENSGFNVRISY